MTDETKPQRFVEEKFTDVQGNEQGSVSVDRDTYHLSQLRELGKGVSRKGKKAD